MTDNKDMRKTREIADCLRDETGINKQTKPQSGRLERVKPKPSRVVGFVDL
ncbi:hypothetical protein ACFLTJ_02290 [Chloroflexota bacterium]